MKQRGRIKYHGVKLRSHEIITVKFLANRGFNIDLIEKSNIPGVHSPDMLLDGLPWEMKSPKGKGKSLMKNILQDAALQSCNVVVDLRRVKRNELSCLRELYREFYNSRHLKRLKIITKDQKVIDIEK